MRIRRGLALVMALLLTLLFALPAGADETGTYDFILNDEILKFSTETPVVEKDGFTCVPFDYFFRQFGGSYIYDDTIRNLTWFHFGTTYSFNISTCTVNREPPVPAPAFYENGAYYLPMEFIAEQLGYIFTKLPNGTCRLVTREKLNFADEDFMLMYSSMYSGGSTERTRPNFYLVVPGQPSSNTAEILSALDRYGVSATFFMTEEAMRANPALTRLIVSSGHPYGFTLPESGDMLAWRRHARLRRAGKRDASEDDPSQDGAHLRRLEEGDPLGREPLGTRKGRLSRLGQQLLAADPRCGRSRRGLAKFEQAAAAAQIQQLRHADRDRALKLSARPFRAGRCGADLPCHCRRDGGALKPLERAAIRKDD